MSKMSKISCAFCSVMALLTLVVIVMCVDSIVGGTVTYYGNTIVGSGSNNFGSFVLALALQGLAPISYFCIAFCIIFGIIVVALIVRYVLYSVELYKQKQLLVQYRINIEDQSLD
jgi:hypothetical protein